MQSMKKDKAEYLSNKTLIPGTSQALWRYVSQEWPHT